MFEWKKFNERYLLKNEDFYSHLNMEHIIDADITRKRILQRF